MKKIISILVALCMLLGVSALAENYEITVSGQVNADQVMKVLPMLGVDPAREGLDSETLNLAFGIVNDLSGHAIVGDDGVLGEILLNNVELANIGITVQDNALVLFSDLLPGYAASVSLDTLKALASLLPDFSKFDIAAYEQIILAYVQTIKTEQAAGAYFVNGKTYATKITVTISEKASAEAINALADRLIADMNASGLTALLESLGADIDPDDLYIKNYGDSTASFNIYMDATGNEICLELPEEMFLTLAMNGNDLTLTLEGDGAVMVIGISQQGEGFTASFSFTEYGEGAVSMAFAVVPTQTGYTITEQVVEMIDGFNMVMMTVSDIAFEGDKLVVDSAEYLMDMMTPVATAHYEIAPYAGQFPAPDFSTYNMLTVEEILTNGGVDDATLQGIQNVLMNQTLSGLMVKILTARPDLMNLVMGTMNEIAPSGV